VFKFDFTPYDSVLFDEARQQLVLIKRDVYYTLALTAVPGRALSLSPPLDFINNGPVLCVRFSYDHRFVAIQRTNTTVEVIDLLNRTELQLACRGQPANRFLLNGICWCQYGEHSHALHLVARRGTEIYKLTTAKLKGTLCKYLRTVRAGSDPTRLFWFTPLPGGGGGGAGGRFHCDGLLLLATSHSPARPSNLRPFLLNGFSPLKLPKIELEPEATIDEHSIRVASMYDRLCCIHLQAPTAPPDTESSKGQSLAGFGSKGRRGSSGAGKCSIYAISRSSSALIRQFVLPQCGQEPSPCVVQMIDNLTVVHHPSVSLAMFFDGKAPTTQPVVAPLPLSVVRRSKASSSSSLPDDGRMQNAVNSPGPSLSTNGDEIVECESESDDWPELQLTPHVASGLGRDDLSPIPTFEVVFESDGPLGLELLCPPNMAVSMRTAGVRSDDQEDARAQTQLTPLARPASTGTSLYRPTIVNGFHRRQGQLGPAERCGKIKVGNQLIAVNNISTLSRTFDQTLQLIRDSPRPLTLRFKRWTRFQTETGSLVSTKPMGTEDTTNTESKTKNGYLEGHNGGPEIENSSLIKRARSKISGKRRSGGENDRVLQSTSVKKYDKNWQFLWPYWVFDLPRGTSESRHDSSP